MIDSRASIFRLILTLYGVPYSGFGEENFTLWPKFCLFYDVPSSLGT